MSLEPLYCDADLLVIDKPAKLLSVPGRHVSECVLTHLPASLSHALIVHRLDMATSGLMVLALSKAIHRALSIAFAERKVDKTYEAVVAGTVQDDEGVIDAPLICDWPNRPLQKIDHEIGKPSVTHFSVLARHNNTTRLSLRPITGRSHQLRVHLAFIGHPIIGDEFYAPEAIKAQSPRLLLHANRLCFTHPVTGLRLDIKTDCPF